MKKIFKSLLVLLLCFGFVGCSKEKNSITIEDVNIKTGELGTVEIKKNNSNFGIKSKKIIFDDDSIAEANEDFIRASYKAGETMFYLEIETSEGEIIKSNKAKLTIDYDWEYYNKVNEAIKNNGYNLKYEKKVYEYNHDYMVLNIPSPEDEEALNKGIIVQFDDDEMLFLDNSRIIDCKFYDENYDKKNMVLVYTPEDDSLYKNIERPTFKTDAQNYEGFNNFIKSVGINSEDDFVNFCNMFFIKSNS